MLNKLSRLIIVCSKILICIFRYKTSIIQILKRRTELFKVRIRTLNQIIVLLFSKFVLQFSKIKVCLLKAITKWVLGALIAPSVKVLINLDNASRKYNFIKRFYFLIRKFAVYFLLSTTIFIISTSTSPRLVYNTIVSIA